MVKSYLIGLNIIAVVVMAAMYAPGKIKFHYGKVVGVNIGETKTITLEIDKANISGTGRLIIDLSRADGITAKILNSAGAIPSKKGKDLIFKWKNLPSDSSFVVTFEIFGELYGTQIIDGEFSYVDGTRKTVQLPKKEIHVYPSKTPHLICHRDIYKFTESTYGVTLEIDPGDLSGFGGIKEDIPDGFAAKVTESGDATVKLDPIRNQLIFTWIELPSQGEKISIKYVLKEIVPKSEIYDIHGFFWAEYMIVDNKSIEYYIPTTNMHGFEKETPEITPVDNTPKGNGDVTFKVQIMAAHKTVGTQYFKQRHKFTADFTVEDHEGWQKYIIGNFPDYQFARDKREELRNSTNLPKPFVTAYNKNNRITVQEALILANQKWLQ